MKPRFWLIGATALMLASCASLPRPVIVLSVSETQAGEASGGPTVWNGGVGPRRPGPVSGGFIATLRPTGGIALHDTAGGQIGLVDGPRLNDLDIAVLPLEHSYTVVAAGTREARGRTRLVLHRMDPGTDQTLRPWGEIRLDLGRPRGLCMRQVADRLTAVLFDQHGEGRILILAEGPDGEPRIEATTPFHVDGAGHGCAIDTLRQTAIVGHAHRGFWAVSLLGDPAPVRLLDPSGRRLPRALGLAYVSGVGGPFIATHDQDRSAFSIWRVNRESVDWLGRFAVRETAGGRAARSLDGIDAYSGQFGAFDGGVVVVQDQNNDGAPNLKLVSWADVRRALGL